MASRHPTDPVADEERLYRRVLPGRSHVTRDQDGALRVSGQAYSDRSRKPSVDRADLCSSLESTRQAPQNGVLELSVSSVRAIDTVVRRDSKGAVIEAFAVDVEPAPVLAGGAEPENLAHALVVTAPEIDKDTTFRRLIEALAMLSQVLELPEDLREGTES